MQLVSPVSTYLDLSCLLFIIKVVMTHLPTPVKVVTLNSM